MPKTFVKILQGYQKFRAQYAAGDRSIMQYLSQHGQNPQIMVIACCDSRVDPALILQCNPGDLFVVRNVANIVPPYEKDQMHHGTSAALEFAIKSLEIKHIILLGHSQCGGINALLNLMSNKQHIIDDDFISNWVSIIAPKTFIPNDCEQLAKLALQQSFKNCLTFPWIEEKYRQNLLNFHLWYFDIKSGEIFYYDKEENAYLPLT